jgi:hypothetical protein
MIGKQNQLFRVTLVSNIAFDDALCLQQHFKIDPTSRFSPDKANVGLFKQSAWLKKSIFDINLCVPCRYYPY